MFSKSSKPVEDRNEEHKIKESVSQFFITGGNEPVHFNTFAKSFRVGDDIKLRMIPGGLESVWARGRGVQPSLVEGF